jgi:plastocyanin
MKSKQPFNLLIILVVIFVLLYGFYIYDSISTEEIEDEANVERYTVEEIIEPEDIIADEITEPQSEDEEVEVLHEVTITITDLKFHPEKITIAPGTTVIWVNDDNVPHKVVAYDRVFYGPRMEPGDKYAFTFVYEGIHRYFDGVFPKIGRGTVIVKEEPLPVTGRIVGIDLVRKETEGKFALLVALFIVMIIGLCHGIYKNTKK